MVSLHSCFNKRGLTIRNDSRVRHSTRDSVPGTNQEPTRRRVLNILDRLGTVQKLEGNSRRKWLGGLLVALTVAFCAASPASAETRSLKLFFIHTKERAEIVYKRNGRYDQRGLNQI